MTAVDEKAVATVDEEVVATPAEEQDGLATGTGGTSTARRSARTSTTHRTHRSRRRRPAWLTKPRWLTKPTWLRAGAMPFVIAPVFTVLYCVISLTRFARLDTPSWDNAIFEQAISGYAHLHAPIVDIKAPGFNQLGDHFSPIIALLAPVYRIFPHAQTLLVAQCLLIGVSIIPIGRAALRVLSPGSATAFTLAYALSFGIQSAVHTDFHEVAFAAPLLAAAGAAGLQRRWRAVAAWSLPLLLVKEDLGMTVAAIGIVALLSGGRRAGTFLIASGVLGWALTVFVAIPAANPAGGFAYWSAFGWGTNHGPGAMQTLFSGWDTKGMTLALTIGITGLLALRSPWFIVALPTILWRFAGDRASFWGTDWHYSLALMPILFTATLDGIARARDGRSAWLARYASHVPAVMAALAVALSLQYPMGDLLKAQTYLPSDRTASAAAAMALMPAGSTVETNRGLITHLTSRYQVYWFDSVGSVVPDFVLFDTTTGNGGDIVGYAQRQHPGARYRLIYDHDQFLVAQHIDGTPTSPGSPASATVNRVGKAG